MKTHKSSPVLRTVSVSLRLSVAALAGLAGCDHYGPSGGSNTDKQLGTTMDGVAEKLERYGSISVSSPLLAPADSTGFEFSIEKNANDYYKDAQTNVSGRAAAAFSSARQSGFGLSVRGDIGATINADIAQSLYERQVTQHLEQRRSLEGAADATFRQQIAAIPDDATDAERAEARAAALAARAQALADAGYAEAPTPPTQIPADQLPAKADGTAPTADTAAAKLAALPELMKLLGDSAPVTLENDDALLKAARDTAIEGMLGLLGEPKRLSFADKKIMIGVSMVAVDPGWQTKRDHAADVSIRCSYDYVPARDERVRAFVNDVIIASNTEMIEELRKAEGTSKHIDNLQKNYNHALAWNDLARQIKPVIDLLNTTKQKELYAKLVAINPSQPTTLRDRLKAATDLLEGVELRAPYFAAAQTVSKDPSAGTATVIANVSDDDKKLVEYAKIVKQGFSDDDLAGINAAELKKLIQNPDIQKFVDVNNWAADKGKLDAVVLELASNLGARARPQSSSEILAGTSPTSQPAGPRASSFALSARVPERANPTVAAVSPMVDADSLDLASSVRESRERSLKLAVALKYLGFGGEAEAFDKYAETVGVDLETRSTFPTMNVYSHSGGLFGFQIGPRLRALNLGNLKPKKGVTDSDISLDRQTFPVLVLIGMDERDLAPRFDYYKGKYMLLEPAVKFSQTSRWLPLKRPQPAIYENTRTWLESERLTQARAVADQLQKLPMSPDELNQAQDMIARFKAAISTTPTSRTPKIVYPGTLDVSALQSANEFVHNARANGMSKAIEHDEKIKKFGSAVRSLKPITGGWESAEAIEDVSVVLQEVLAERRTQMPTSADIYVRERLTMLSFHAFGSSHTQDIPLRILLPQQPTPTPTIARVEPSAIELHGTKATVLLVGANLKSVDEKSLGFKAAVPGSITEAKATKVGETAIAVEITVASDKLPTAVWFELPYTVNNEKKTLVTPGVHIVGPTRDPVIKFETPAGSRKLIAPRGSDPAVIGEVIGNPKDKDEKKKDGDKQQGKTEVELKLEVDLKATTRPAAATTKPAAK